MTEIEKQEQAQVFLLTINDIYDDFKITLKKYCNNKHIPFNEDIYHDTILNVHDIILKHGLKDISNDGCCNYMFKSFKMNNLRQYQYANHSKRDYNIINIQELHELHEHNLSEARKDFESKVKKDLYNDYCIINILKLVEEEFDSIDYYCFRLKYLIPNMTYQKLKDLTKINNCKQKVLNIKRYLQYNFDEKSNKEAFLNEYSDFI